MHRHPENPDLHLHCGNSFKGMQLMVEEGPFIEDYLSRLAETIELAVDQYPRVFAFRVGLCLPQRDDLPVDVYTNDVISRFFESFKAKIEHDRRKARDRHPRAHDCKVRYVWAREVGRGERPHYHLLILLNGNAYRSIGRLQSKADNMFNRLQGAWASALGLSVDQIAGLVEIPENAVYRLYRSPRCGYLGMLYAELFYRGSCLCTAATKYFGDGQHGFGSSRG